MDWQAFLAMGGYAPFVWPSYGLALIVLVANWLVPHRRERRLLAAAARRARAESPS
jgi:heme exporter protein D